MNDEERTKLYVELWKQAIATQQHFNDLEWRIRSLALTVLTFSLGGAAVAIKDATAVVFVGVRVQLAAVVLMAGLLVWGAFYFVDQVWYHRLLVGAVRHAEMLEAELRVQGLSHAGLAHEISRASPYRLRLRYWPGRQWNITMHSAVKLRIFYIVVASLLAALAVTTQLASRPV